MFPIALDLEKTSILLIGKGEAFERRHKKLLEYGANSLSVWDMGKEIKKLGQQTQSVLSQPDTQYAASRRHEPSAMPHVKDRSLSRGQDINISPHPNPLPKGEGIKEGYVSKREGIFGNANIIMIAGLSYDESKKIAEEAKSAGKLVNVEDMNELCDFYFTANVKRGDLMISVSTGGASPALARRIRDYIATKFGEQWKERVREMAEFRSVLKKEGKTIPQVLHASDEFLQEKGWLK